MDTVTQLGSGASLCGKRMSTLNSSMTLQMALPRAPMMRACNSGPKTCPPTPSAQVQPQFSRHPLFSQISAGSCTGSAADRTPTKHSSVQYQSHSSSFICCIKTLIPIVFWCSVYLYSALLSVLLDNTANKSLPNPVSWVFYWLIVSHIWILVHF